MTKLEIIGQIKDIMSNGGGIGVMRGVDNKIGRDKWFLSWYELNSLSKDDIISFLAEKSLTYTLVEIRRSILSTYHWYLIFKESSDFQTNLDADVIEAIVNSLWTYEDERKWGNDHYPFKK